MTEVSTDMTTKTEIIDEFLEKHGAGLPAHIVDFALDMRTIIAELEDMLDRVPAGAV
ncbi:MAG: hypothetical protein ACFCVC_08315 [Acidimicrobiia bacterium]